MTTTLDAIRALAAAQSGSMAAAARGLGIDKATVSRRLTALERERPGLFENRGGLAQAAKDAVPLETYRRERAWQSEWLVRELRLISPPRET